jgi:hypothetical protein
MDALAAATRHAAEALGLGHRIGTIAEGRIADFVVLDADPLEDIRNTRRIRKVIQGGRVVDREALREWESQQVAITDELERERIVAVIAAFARAREEANWNALRETVHPVAWPHCRICRSRCSTLQSGFLLTAQWRGQGSPVSSATTTRGRTTWSSAWIRWFWKRSGTAG